MPPNLLVGDGAADFASENGFSVVPHEFLISEEARKRWQKWRIDLAAVAEARQDNGDDDDHSMAMPVQSRAASTASSNHTPPSKTLPTPLSTIPTPTRPLAASAVDLPSEAMGSNAGHTPHPARARSSQTYGSAHDHDTHWPASSASATLDEATDMDFADISPVPSPAFIPTAKRPRLSSSVDGFDGDRQKDPLHEIASSLNTEPAKQEDNIVDTVGAIAIDGWGNIAGGSSSGGIGMKHKGRCGPAALVGVGTAVIPRDERDVNLSSVATVVSGTGEHMATTMAASAAAERIYYSHRKIVGGYEGCTEDEALEGMINNEFINHPGVRQSPCTGAIGILGVKKSKDGIYFYFAHNTDSFAIASMHSEERKPVCVMSRNARNGSLAQGGRLCRSKYARK